MGGATGTLWSLSEPLPHTVTFLACGLNSTAYCGASSLGRSGVKTISRQELGGVYTLGLPSGEKVRLPISIDPRCRLRVPPHEVLPVMETTSHCSHMYRGVHSLGGAGYVCRGRSSELSSCSV